MVVKMSSYSTKVPFLGGALVVSACVPVPDIIRASLQPYLSATQSKALYRRILLDTLDTIQDVEGMDFYIAYAPRGGRKSLEGIVPATFRFLCHSGHGTGLRLSRLFPRLLMAGYERVLVVCSNYPDLPACILQQAAEALESDRVDMVFGPSERGGFYLLGLKNHHPSLFTEIDWDSNDLEGRLRRWSRKQRVRLRVLPTWYDIRTVEDLRRHLTYYSILRDSRSESSLLSQTGEYLDRIQDCLVPRVQRVI